MHKRSSKDVNQMAAEMVRATAGLDLNGKNPAAVALGRMGGLKGWQSASGYPTPEKLKRNSGVRSANSLESRKRVNLFDESLNRRVMNDKLAKLRNRVCG